MDTVKKIYARFCWLEQQIAMVLLAAITVLVFVSALTRTFGYPINWAQDAFGGKEQIALLMQQVGRPCALADADQQDAADTLAEAGEAPVGVSLQDGYLLVNFTGWTAE